jgi:Ca2+-binding EF-hand superfamily protein
MPPLATAPRAIQAGYILPPVAWHWISQMEWKMTKFLLGGTVLAALIAPATAQVAPGAHSPMTHQGRAMQVHSRAQVGAHVQTAFQRLDINRDGFVTRDESQAARRVKGSRAERRANRAAGVRQAGGGAAFDRMDVNRDGVLSRQEFTSARANRQQRLAGADGQNRRRLGEAGARGMRGGGMGAGMGMAALRGRMFDMADINRDARVSLQEATVAAYRHFDMADANRDGQVTRDERKALHQRMRGARRAG